MTRGPILLCAALAAVLCCVAPAVAGAAVRRGLNVDALGAGGSRSLDDLQQAHADTARFELSWSQLEPNAPSGGTIAPDPGYVAQVDATLSAAARRGIHYVVVLAATPCWASSAPDDQRAPCVAGAHSSDYERYAPTHASDYAAVAAWVAHRWGSQLAALELWNEPNYTSFFTVNDPAAYTGADSLWVSDPAGATGTKAAQASDEAAAYAQLLAAAYPAIKAGSPGLTVLGGALAYSAGGFLSRLYADGIHGSFDALSIHPYDDRPLYERTGNRAVSYAYGVPDVHAVMTGAGDGDRQLWLTEFGWPTCAPTVMDWCVTEGEQASRLTDAFRLAAGWPYVGATLVYTLRDPGTDQNDFQQNMGLLRNDWSPKPAWQAFVEAIAPAVAAPPAPAPQAPPAVAPLGALPASALPPPAAKTHTRRRAVRVLHVRRLRGRRVRIEVACRGRTRCRSRIEVWRGRVRVAAVTLAVRRGGHASVVVRIRGAASGRLRVASMPV